jgi:hypothetical protein
MLMSADMPGPAAPSSPMRRLLFAGGAVLLLVPHGFGSPDFSRTWVLDLRVANSPDQILKRLGASWVECRLGSSVQLELTYIQTPHLLTVYIRGPAFQRSDLIRINNQPETKEEPRTGRYAIRIWWSGNGTQLVSAVSLRTKDSCDAQLTIVRELPDGAKTLILNGTLKIKGDSGTWVRRVWRKAHILIATIIANGSGHHSKAGGGGNITLRVWAAHRDAGTAAHSLETRT